jgi:hypothetical protein
LIGETISPLKAKWYLRKAYEWEKQEDDYS